MTWFTSGYPEPDPLTAKQKHYLLSAEKKVVSMLVPAERTAALLMGYEKFVDSLNKSDASTLIGRAKGELVADGIRRGDSPEETDRILRQLRERSERALENLKTQQNTPRKWWNTGLSTDAVGATGGG